MDSHDFEMVEPISTPPDDMATALNRYHGIMAGNVRTSPMIEIPSGSGTHQPPVSPPARRRGDYLIGVVDMGSNGIRFSVTDLTPPLARILPTVFDYRVNLSLYDCQFDPETGEQVPIPETVIDDVIAVLNRFRLVCGDLGVSQANCRIVATEATRAARNSRDFLAAIRSRTGFRIDLLRKEEEGQIGALGVASGYTNMEGLMMDLGGGSTQITWIVSQGGNVRISHRGSFSFPYGAAALTQKLHDLRHGQSRDEGDKAVARFRADMVRHFEDAYRNLGVPESLVERAEREGGFPLYLSGGGFRGWGYLLLYVNQTGGRQYPISIINGYAVGRHQFADTRALEHTAEAAHSLFRVSDRRRHQVPAVAFLIHALAEAIPHGGVREAHFCQGGVREGVLFRDLLPSVRAQSPLEVATQRFRPHSWQSIRDLIRASVPEPSKYGKLRFPSDVFGPPVTAAFANTLYVHMAMSKESSSTAALYSTSVGQLASAHGVGHADRARLALLLEARYMGELPPREQNFRHELRRILSHEEVWWCQYLGRVGYLISRLYPAGTIDEARHRVVVSSEWAWNLGRRGDKEGLVLTISVQKAKDDPAKLKQGIEDHVNIIEKAGKRKNWAGGEDGWGMKVKVRVVEEDIL